MTAGSRLGQQETKRGLTQAEALAQVRDFWMTGLGVRIDSRTIEYQKPDWIHLIEE